MKRGIRLRFDAGLLFPVFLLVAVSLTALFSINISYFQVQFVYLLISLVAFVVFSQVNVRIMQLYALPIYIISLLLLLFLLFLGIESRGAVRWIDIFGFRIQFSEVCKPFLAFALATYLSQHALSFRTFITSIVLTLPVFLLILIQPDLGSALIYAGSLVIALIVAGFPLVWFAYGAGVVALLLPVLWQFMHDYQRQRLLTFLHPTNDPLGTSYNAIQSIIAVGSGMFFGKGLGETTQSGLRFLPERHTDFIFATISEGLGFVGACIIVLATLLLLYRICRIFYSVDDRFCKLYAVFTFSIIFIQFFFNVGMNIGLIPIVGITLPFVSYGGSSLLSNFILLGLLVAVHRLSQDKKVLEIK